MHVSLSPRESLKDRGSKIMGEGGKEANDTIFDCFSQRDTSNLLRTFDMSVSWRAQRIYNYYTYTPYITEHKAIAGK